MRITLINQFYPPDLAPTGHMTASLAAHRASLGDHVTVLTSVGGYVPEEDDQPFPTAVNLSVLRMWTPRLGKNRKGYRILDYAAFYLLAAVRMLAMSPQDVIISLTTPPFIAWAAVLHQWLHPSTRIILWNMDCYPEIAEETGVIKKGGLISRLLRTLNRRLFKRLDQVVCLDPAMRALLQTQYAYTPERPSFNIIPNWEPGDQFPPDSQPEVWADAPPFDTEDPFVVLYLGNAGFGHRFETVIEAAELLAGEPFVFLFVGGGQQWPWLAEAAGNRSLKNLILRPYVPKRETPSVMAFADCALITMRDRALGLISPSKLHANLAMSLPVLYIGPENSNVDIAIKQYDFGVSLRHGDASGAAAFLRRLRSNPEEYGALRKKARLAFDLAFTDSQALPRFDEVLERSGSLEAASR